MPRTPAARLALGPSDHPALPTPAHAPFDEDVVVATVGSRSPLLLGPDWIRIDGGQSLVDVVDLVRRFAPLPAVFDIPGAHSPRYRNLLTTTELLVFAASAEFGWVNLRDLVDPAELDRARQFVGPQTRLTCTVGDPRVLQRHLDELCESGDGLLLDLRALGQNLPPSYRDVLLDAVLKRTREHGTPVLLVGGAAGATPPGTRGASARLGELGRLLAAGARGLVLTRETEFSPRPQDAVDLARDLIDQVRALTAVRPSARLRRGASDDSGGWIRS